MVESVVYTSFLVDAAKEVGIEVEKVRECPYFRSPATKDQAVQASFSCPDYVALESLMMTDESELGQGRRSPTSKTVKRTRVNNSCNGRTHGCSIIVVFILYSFLN